MSDQKSSSRYRHSTLSITILTSSIVVLIGVSGIVSARASTLSCSTGIFPSESMPKPQKHEHLLRVHKSRGKSYHEMVQIREWPDGKGGTTRVISRVFREGLPPGLSCEEAASKALGAEWFYRQVEPIVMLAKEKFDRRDWSEEFKAKTVDVAKNFLNDSTYIGKFDDVTGRVIGGIRIISAPFGFENGVRVAKGEPIEKRYGPAKNFRARHVYPHQKGIPAPPLKLPEAEFLDLEFSPEVVPTKNSVLEIGIEHEIGTFAIDETLPPQEQSRVWLELWIQLILFAFDHYDHAFNLYGNIYHTYADPKSLRLYLPLGFTYLRRYKHKGKWVEYGPNEIPEPIVKDGVKWWPLVWYPENMVMLNEQIGSETLRRFQNLQVATRRNQVVSQREPILEGVTPLLERLKSGDDYDIIVAGTSLVHLMEQHAVHYQKLLEASSNPDRAMRALQAFQGMQDVFRRLHAAFEEIKDHPNYEVRMELARMLSWITQVDVPRPHLNNKQIYGEFFPHFLSDPHVVVVINALQELRALKPDEWLKTTNSDEDALGHKKEIAQKARVELGRLGYTHEEVGDVASALAQSWLMPVGEPYGVVGVELLTYRWVKQAAYILYKTRNRTPEVVRLFLTLAAAEAHELADAHYYWTRDKRE